MHSRDEAEDALAAVVDDTTRNFLRRLLDAVLAAIRERRFDEAQPVLALGVILGWWTDAVSDRVVLSIQDSWQAAFSVVAGGDALVSARSDAMAFHIAAVKDRLSRRALPEVPEKAFDEIRLSQSAAALGGWDHKRQARDIAERLAWEPEKAYWKRVKAEAEEQIDRILDPLGKPGTPARTYAHKNDPQVKVWQEVRAGAVDKIKEDEPDWQVRAARIARTEATAAWNSGSLAALAAEGRTHKRWLASKDDRTRDSHRAADGQVVPLSRPFRVGEHLLMMPGDPAAPPWEVINCRCTVVGADEPPRQALTAAYNPRQARVPAGNGRLSGRWLDMPDKVIDDLLADLGTRKRRKDAQEAVAWVERARDAAASGDDKALDRALTSAERVMAYEVRSRPAYQPDLDAIREAKAAVEEYRSVDWSLADQEGDIGGGTEQVGSDTAVSPEAAAVLNKWVQLGGSFTQVSPEDRALLADEVEARGEKAPALYRGANLSSAAAAKIKPGQALDLGVVSTSEDEGSALPYAENGPDTPVLFVFEGARGLNVQDRAEAESGYAEQEWVVAGQFCVQSVEQGEEMVVALRPCAGGNPVSLTAASGPGVGQARVPRGNGRLSGRWVDMPGAVLDALAADPPPHTPDLRPATDEDRAAFKGRFGRTIPPSWRDVEVDMSPGAALVARGKDKQGRTVRIYTQEHHDRQAAKKFQRLKEVHAALPKIERALAEVGDDPTRAAARLMYLEGIRVGSTDDQLGKVKAYGATTLRAEHAVAGGDTVTLSFVAKEGIPVEYVLDDPELVAHIGKRLAEDPAPDEPLFPGATASKTMTLLREASGVPGIKNHDLRTLLANRLAAAYLDDVTPPPPETPREAAALRRKVGEFVASHLRNKPAQALSSYINPAIFAAIREA